MDKEVKKTINELKEFRDERGWQKYHSLIGLSRALGIEASEVEKIFLWKKQDSELSDSDLNNLKMEIADVLIYAFYMCDKLQVDPIEIMQKKIAINHARHWKFDQDK